MNTPLSERFQVYSVIDLSFGSAASLVEEPHSIRHLSPFIFIYLLFTTSEPTVTIRRVREFLELCEKS